jgi:arabinan endo-1,5-alpha-L-arabinosidase
VRRIALVLLLIVAGCGSSDSAAPGSSGVDASVGDAAASVGDARTLDAAGSDSTADAAGDATNADAAAPCTTRVTYGYAWIHGASHPTQFDDTDGLVTWDGTCTNDGANSYALLSNGWKPYFTGNSACVLALDATGSCGAVASSCATRVAYGGAWEAPANHPASYDDVTGRVFSDGLCTNSGADSYASLSNGWQPHFTGNDACALSLEYTQCGGLYENPVIPMDCPDPGVLRDGTEYILSCTSGDAADAFPIFTSPDLVTWTQQGHIFPTWAASDFWAPEIHKVGTGYVAYFSARDTDGMLSIGVASASSPLGPFTDIGAPLVHDSAMGHIDASEINAADGNPYALWKDDGNAIGMPTPIHAQRLTPNGLALTGSPVTLITNDQSWEGAVTEGPFMVSHAGTYFLFYSGNAYDTAAYAVGVASSSSPLGPFTKAPGPILTSNAAWGGPGHCSVVDTFAGDTYMVNHSWQAGDEGASGAGRMILTDAITWGATWPSVPLAPSSTTRPMP